MRIKTFACRTGTGVIAIAKKDNHNLNIKNYDKWRVDGFDSLCWCKQDLGLEMTTIFIPYRPCSK